MKEATLQPASGPEDPPSSRPLAGCLRGQVYRYEFDPASGIQRLEMLDGSITATEGTVVDWAFYADGVAAVHPPHAALAVTIDVRFMDGTRLSDDPLVRDRYDFPITAEAQFNARWSMPEQWSANSVSLGPRTGDRGVVEVVLGASSLLGEVTGMVSGFVEVVVRERSPSNSLTGVERVDTRRGTHSGTRFSRGNTIPAVAVPHGFTFITPATDAANPSWPYQPFVHDDARGRRLEAIQFSHQPSPWIGDRGVLQLMPFRDGPVSDREVRRRWIMHGSEVAMPHRWSAELDDGCAVAVTATSHAAAFRVVSADPSAVVGLVVDQLYNHGELRFTAPDRLEGWVPEEPEQGNQPRTFFAGRVLTSVTGHGHLDDASRGTVAGFVAGLGACEVRVAISYLSTEQAWRSLELEAPAEVCWDELSGRAHDEWERVLGRVVVPPLPEAASRHRALADQERRAILAHALYRMHLYPNTSGENAGTAESPQWFFADPMLAAAAHTSGRTGAPVAAGDVVVNNGYWDTYRTVWSALSLLDGPLAARLADGTLEQYRRGGWMTRWSAPGYVDCMVGTSSDQIFADVERWGVPLDAEAAFESGWRNACEPSPHTDRGRNGIRTARFTGFVSRDVTEGMSWSLENAISDASLGRMAGRLFERTDDSRYDAFERYFRNRSLAYRSMFDPRHGFFRGRLADGSFPDEDFDPRMWGGDNVETNAWGMSVTAVHDGAGLAELYGGPVGLRHHLDALFGRPEMADPRFAGTYEMVIHEQREARALRSGQCAISNQPAHHIPYMYAFTDQPWRAGATAHGLAARLFAGGMIGQGFPGDEDNGEMSAWWLWAALGLYPLELGSGELLIGCPLLDDVEVHRAGGARLRIRTDRSRPDARVLTAAHLNGVALRTCWLPIDELQDDAVLELQFAHEDEDPSALGPGVTAGRMYRQDLTGTATGQIVSTPGITAENVFDDGASDDVILAPGQWVGWCFDDPVTVTDATVTVGANASVGSLLWEASVHGQTFAPVSMTHQETLLARRTTPFRFDAPKRWRAVRVLATAPVSLSQVELFALEPTR